MRNLPLLLALSPAAALAQFAAYDQGPLTGTEGELVTVPAQVGNTLQFYAERITFTQRTPINRIVLYSNAPLADLGFEIRFDVGGNIPGPGTNFATGRIGPLDDLGPVPGSGLRAYGANFMPFVALDAGDYWFNVRSRQGVPFSLATVRNSDDDLSYTGTSFGATYSVFPSRPGDMMVQLGSVPEPATMAVLGLGLAALKRRRRG